MNNRALVTGLCIMGIAVLVSCIALISVKKINAGEKDALTRESYEPEPDLPEQSAGVTYYIDSFGGDDSADGLSPDTPWQSLDKINENRYNPGDRILLKAGSIFEGTLHPSGSGAPDAPIVIDMYGEGSRPIINANGRESAVYLMGQKYIEINHLEVTNDADSEGRRRGIYVQATGKTAHIHIKNCYVHNVRGDNDFSTGKPTGGIIIMGNGSGGCMFEDVLIEGNTVDLCDRTGIYFGDGCGDGKAFVNKGFVMRGNSINYPGGDGAIIHFTDGGLIEYNTVNTTDNVSIQVSAGIWPWYCKDTVFQYNEGYGCKYSFDYDDGMPWDIDGGNEGCIYQYNYSHDNDGGSVMICADETCPSDNSVIRYNVSQNDGGRVLTLTGPSTNTQFYNNTIYVGEGMKTAMIGANHLGGDHSGLSAYNNIFYNLGSGGFDMGGSQNNDFDHNLYFGENMTNIPDDKNGLFADPGFVNPGSGKCGRSSVGGYRLKAGSPCIDAGRFIEDNGGKDYWGTALLGEGTIDIGAMEFIP
ncbi:MAG: right-handed parallel beta-helix repeat-containing protein [Acetatifactor sp.]|nr:right-handed parallel beta-helix repeat-containing protein [Acetatifactor sp.]